MEGILNGDSWIMKMFNGVEIAFGEYEVDELMSVF